MDCPLYWTNSGIKSLLFNPVLSQAREDSVWLVVYPKNITTFDNLLNGLQSNQALSEIWRYFCGALLVKNSRLDIFLVRGVQDGLNR
jgi:hypothetical protein